MLGFSFDHEFSEGHPFRPRETIIYYLPRHIKKNDVLQHCVQYETLS